ncbi:IS66-like element accessory protein TnpA [Belnapia rosea]|uniref:IS66-like element accessory protein TnpA n=1 Tax=Belnapia rosea TaxID=938405 RepID=UPI0008872209|nr:transposase [Belnapia rosea]SDB74917.1 transposase [Belnapia rosea]
MEIITGVERRRPWRAEEKLRILAELNEPGVKFSEVARRHDVSRGLLWQWRDAQRRGRLVAETPGFLPLQVVPEMVVPAPPGGSGPRPCAGLPAVEDEADERIEIVLPDGTAVRVAASISAAALRRVLAVLRA